MTRTVILSVSLLLASMVAPLWAFDFDHQAHVEEYVADVDCTFCHADGAETIKPSTEVCLDCHDAAMIDEIVIPEPYTHGPTWALDHGPTAQGDAIDCAACHEQKYCLDCHKAGFAHEMGEYSNNMINVHRSDFHVTHPIAARTDQNLCSSCHEPEYCNQCHEDWRFRSNDIGSPSHRRTFDLGLDGDIDAIHAGIQSNQCDSCHTGGLVVADFHDWSIGHAREARRSLMTCQSCHPDGDVCLRCHSAKGGAGGFNPHGDDWDDIADRLNDASNGRTCKRCH